MTAKNVSIHWLLVVMGALLLSPLACKTLEPLMPATTEGLVATFQGHTEAVLYVAFSPDGTTVASSSADKTVRLWDVATGEELSTFYGHPTMVYDVAFSPNGTLLASVNGWFWVASHPLRFDERSVQQTPIPTIIETPVPLPNKVILWDLATGAEQRRWEFDFDTPIYTVAFSPDGRTLAAGGGDPSGALFGESAVWLWNIATGELKAMLRERKFATVWSIAFSPDGTTLASGNGMGITLWDIDTGESRASLSRSDIGSVAFSPDGTLLASGHPSGSVRLWDMATNQEQATLDEHDGIVHALAFSPDGTILASASQDGTVRLWDVAARDIVATIRLPQTPIWSVAFSPDGTLLASGSDDGLVRLWDVAQMLGQ